MSIDGMLWFFVYGCGQGRQLLALGNVSASSDADYQSLSLSMILICLLVAFHLHHAYEHSLYVSYIKHGLHEMKMIMFYV